MVLSFVYLVFVALLKLLLRSGRRVDVKDSRSSAPPNAVKAA